ncbi:MAG: hypothetical protein ABIN94_22790 [Ferruginibacter sp.]
MPSAELTPALPPNFLKYLKDGKRNPDGSWGEHASGHLKIMATIADEIGVIQWAIFFGNKGSRGNDDPDLATAYVKSYAISGGKKWKNERPLWLIPISRAARDEAFTQLEPDNFNYTPSITGKTVVIRNSGKSTGNWDYKFWYEQSDPDQWTADPVLILTSDSYLKSLSPKGEWKSIRMAVDEEFWPVWITTDSFDGADRLIAFRSPSCDIVNEKGLRAEHELWFGVSVNYRNIQRVNFPFISINETIKPHLDKDDCPVVWTNRSRVEDMAKPANINEKVLQAKDWTRIRPVDKTAVSAGSAFNQILGIFDGDVTSQLYAWLIKEEGVDNSGEQTILFHVFFCRNYFTKGTLADIIGGLNISATPVDNNVSVVQICRGSATNFITRIRYFSYLDSHNNDNKFINLWNESVKKIEDGLSTIHASSPVGLVLKLSNKNPGTFSYVSEWQAQAQPCASSQLPYDYSLIASKLVSNNSVLNITLNEITLPLLKHQRFPLPNDEKDIVLKNAILGSSEEGYTSVNDNGTLFQLFLLSYTPTLTNTGGTEPIVLRDGAMAFTVAAKTSDEDLPNKYGRLRLTLQLTNSQRPFFLWQWHEAIDNQDKIAVSYAIEDFSLPITKVEAAGQDMLAKDKLLAPGSLSTAIEGFGERSEPPLVIPLSPDTEGQYLLTMSESVNIGQDYRFDIRLQEFNPQANINNSTQIKAIVLDSSPQMISLINARFLQQPGYDDGAWILARRSPFSEEAGGWEILDDSAETEGFHMVLPSQTIGEAYVKGRPEEPLPEPEGEPREYKSIEYRLGSPAILRLAPERLERRYVAPPWNLRRILGQAGDGAPGIPFLETQFELLYGLTGNLKPEKAFIAELGSKLGEVPVPPVNSMAWQPTNRQKEAFNKKWKAYLDVYRAWKSRLAILEPSVEDDFGHANFDKDISFKPRIEFEVNKKEIEIFLATLQTYINGTYPHLPETTKENLKNLIIKTSGDVNTEASYYTFDDNIKNLVSILTDEVHDNVYPALIEQLTFLKKIGASLKYPILQEKVNKVFDELVQFLKTKFPGLPNLNIIGTAAQDLEHFFTINEFKNVQSEYQKIILELEKNTVELNDESYRNKYEKIRQAYPLLQKIVLADGTEILDPRKLLNPEEIKNSVKKMIAAHDKNGLAGGFHYGFESEAIYKEFWREAFAKGSSSGEIKALAYSSVGGWGKQTARFASDKTVIKSTTTLGRAHFYAVERIGRIGVFWHKAKHVIEYERTVVPSEQFQSYQPGHTGRPLVRKVREYVEILEPSRPYPDFSTDPQDAPGSVTGCTFKSIIIPVLSAWGHDVWGFVDQKDGSTKKDTIGWEVPLWKPGADPKIYPKPQVVVSVLAPRDSDEKQIIQNLQEPENLWFYTDTREWVVVNGAKIEITSEVHAWPAVQEVDFTNLPEPEQYDIEPAAGDSPELIGQPMPDVLDVLPGFERFTFRVERNEIPSSVAGRYYGNSAVSGRMRTVSMMRSVFNKEKANWWAKTNDENVKKAKDALSKLIKTKDALLALSANGFTELNNKIQNGVETKIDDYKKQVMSFVTQSGCLAELGKISKDVGKPDLQKLEKVKIIDNGVEVTVWEKGKGFEYPTKWLWREVLNASEGFINNAIGFYDAQARIFTSELEQLLTNSRLERGEAIAILNRFKDRVTAFRNNLEFGVDLLSSIITETINNFNNVFNQLHNAIDANEKDLLAFIDNLSSSVADLNEARLKIKNEVKGTIDLLKEKIENIPDPWGSIIENQVQDILHYLDKWLEDVNKKIDAEYATVGELIANTRIFIQENTSAFKNGLFDILKSVKNDLVSFLGAISNDIQAVNRNLVSVWDDIWDDFITQTDDAFAFWQTGETIVMTTVKENLGMLREFIIQQLIEALLPVLYSGVPNDKVSIFRMIEKIDSIIKSIKEWVISSLLHIFGVENVDYEKWFNTIGSLQDLKRALESGDKEAIITAANTFANHINQEFGELVGEVTQKYRDADRAVKSGEELIQTGKQTLNNFRSVWEEFTAPGMGLNRRTVAMIVKTDWKSVEQRLSLTPCISRVKQFGEDLEGLGLRLPVAAITDRLLPAGADWNDMKNSLLGKFDFSNLFSDLGGMRFDKLFPGFKMPEFARDKIKITHSADRKNLSAWIKAEADVVLPDKKKLLSIGPVVVELEKGRFTGEIKFEGDLEGKLTRRNSGRLSGSFHISVAGTGLMIFRETSIIFNQDKLSFDLDPSRMEMPGLLKMLTDATTKLSDTGAGGTDENGEKKQVFKIGITKVREIPAGIKASLDIPPISIGGGTTAITNLCFGGHFELKALDERLRPKFLLGFGFYVGKREAPFNVTIFILGGGGYIFCNLTFEPKRGLTVEFVMSINVSATLAIAAGWMTGYVSIMAGLEGEYHKTPQTGGSVYITIYVRVIGLIELMSIVSVFLFLGLEATYRTLGNGGNELVGTGYVRLEIRICRFFKIKVAKSYTKKFAGSGGSGNTKQVEAAFAATIVASREDIIVNKSINILKSLA